LYPYIQRRPVSDVGNQGLIDYAFNEAFHFTGTMGIFFLPTGLNGNAEGQPADCKIRRTWKRLHYYIGQHSRFEQSLCSQHVKCCAYPNRFSRGSWNRASREVIWFYCQKGKWNGTAAMEHFFLKQQQLF